MARLDKRDAIFGKRYRAKHPLSAVEVFRRFLAIGIQYSDWQEQRAVEAMYARDLGLLKYGYMGIKGPRAFALVSGTGL